MRGKKAKRLRRLAASIRQKQGSEGNYSEEFYHQSRNCRSLEPDIEHRDGDGVPMLRPVLNPGTITHASQFMRVYRALKKMSKRGGR